MNLKIFFAPGLTRRGGFSPLHPSVILNSVSMFGLSDISWLRFLAFSIGLILVYNAAVFVYFKFLDKGDDGSRDNHVEEKFNVDADDIY